MLRVVLNSKPAFWLLLAIPGLWVAFAWFSGDEQAMDLIHPTGEFSARLMIVAMCIAPLIAVIGPRPWLRWLLARRRALGVAAFAYAVFHLVLYVADMGTLTDMLAEIAAPGIWTGWIAFGLMIPLALTSNDAAMRWLKAGWKQLQRLAYPAAALVLAHWVLIHNDRVAALVHFAPLIVLLLLRLFRFPRHSMQGSKS